jgi:dTDP-4-amino-4,6-dideoxygalactose transaminase
VSSSLPVIPVARPWLDERDAAAARRAILSGWVTQGPEVQSFEREFAEAVSAEHACAVSSCTTALHLALLAVGVGPGDEVVTVSHSFIATANAIRYCGALPVFVDVTLETFNIDPALVEAAMTNRTKALLVVHQLGLPCDMPALVALASRRGLPVVEDAACAIGSEIQWQGRWERIGRPHGTVACFSFHPRKLLSTGDGGMLTTRSAELNARVRLLRQHGMSVPDHVRHTTPQVIFEEYGMLGFNYRLTDIQAAIGREQLTRLPVIVARRRELAATYDAALHGCPGVVPPREPAWARTNWQSYAIRLEPGVDQKRVMQQMLEEGVSTRRGPGNAHNEQAYPPGSWRTTAAGLTRSEEASRTSVVLPLYHDMTLDDQERVVAALTRAVAR